MDILESHKESILSRANEYGACQKLATEYRVSYTAMRNFLRKNGIKFRQTKLTKDVEEAMVADFQSGKSSVELSEKYGVTPVSVCNYMRRHGIDTDRIYRAKTINHDFFKTLNENACWVLGWFFTDGNVNKKTNHFSVTVQKQDEPLLHLINKIMGVDKESVYHPKDGHAPSLFGCDATIHADLIELGCVPRKSLIVEYPTVLTEDWQHWAFLRGVLEGDGSIALKSKGNRPGFYCDISSGSKSFLEKIGSILKEKLNIDSEVIFRAKTEQSFSSSYKLVIIGGREPIMRFLNAIYKNGTAEHYLERKFAIYLKMKEVMLRPPAYDHVNRDKYCEGYFLSPEGKVYHVIGFRKFARELGIPITVFCNIMKPRKLPFVSRKFGWGPATPDQIAAARASNSLIEKHY